MPNISQRGIDMPASPIRKLAPFAVAAKQKGIKVYHLNIGQPDIATPQEGLDALKNIDRKVLEYSPSQGYQSYLDRLVEYYGRYDINIDASNIIVTCGGSEALQFAFLTCFNPGDELIVPEPVYANYMGFANEMGVKVRPITTKIENGYSLPAIEEFEKLINERTRAIMICNPNNPTGTLYSDEELMQLRDLVKKHDLYLISDEVYREFRYSDKPYLSALHLEGLEDNVIVVDSVSKRYSECGIRIGAFITRNKKLHATVMKFAQARLSPPLIGQIVAEASLAAPQAYHQGVYDEYIARRNCLVEGLNKIPGVFAPMPTGAFYAMAKFPVEDCDDFCRWCLEEFSYEGETVMMAPATGFYATPGAGKNEVRMAYVLKIEDLKRALVVLEKALEAYNAR
ncbi:MAG: pyridoxal phosphate-dependent aminotransferase [Muribaculaceae bacterium]|nr:pyridoxal phosphate-dependent aminotransferase [Muribaculaceae bacterium]